MTRMMNKKRHPLMRPSEVFCLRKVGLMKENSLFVNWPMDRSCTDEEWMRLLTIIVLSPTYTAKIIKLEKRIPSPYVL